MTFKNKKKIKELDKKIFFTRQENDTKIAIIEKRIKKYEDYLETLNDPNRIIQFKHINKEKKEIVELVTLLKEQTKKELEKLEKGKNIKIGVLNKKIKDMHGDLFAAKEIGGESQ